MNQKKEIGKKIIALLLFIAVVLPISIQFIHLFEAHEHVVCTEQSTHIHQLDIECEICSYHLTSFDYSIAKYPDLTVLTSYAKVDVNHYSLQLSSFSVTNTQLRAPPINS